MKPECIDIKSLLYAYIDNELTNEQNMVVTNHISKCPSCKADLASIYRVHDMIKSVYRPTEEIDLSKKIMVNIKFNNKYTKNNSATKEKQVNNIKNESFLSKVILDKLLYISIVAATIIFVIGVTVTYFEKSNPVYIEMANQSYDDKYEDYVIEHYTNSYTNISNQASIISVNFEK